MIRTGVITGVSVSHTNASVDEIEAASSETVAERVERLLAEPGVSEAFAIGTCNRAEAYVVTDRAEQGRQALADITTEVRTGAVDHMDHEASLRHLMRVAAGLESLVLGEDQIIGQLKTAFEASRAADGIGPLLEDAITKAIHVGERARTETAINEGVVSLGSAAVELARRETDLEGSTALVVGAGEMGSLAASALESAGVGRILVANRTIPHATHIAEAVDADASAIGLDAAASAAERATVVITATGSPEYVLKSEGLAEAGETICIDLAQPRDIDPDAEELAEVELFDIDALESVTESTHRQRQAAATEVEAMIDEEFDRLLALFKRKRADEAISTMYESAERVKNREVGTAFAKLDAHGELTDHQREVIESLADSLVGQLLSAPTKSLREAAAEDDWTTIQTAMQLFNPEFDGELSPSEDTADNASTELPAERPEEIPDGVPKDEIPPHVLEQLSND
ncbi:glutamyl-tRNA reductase [Halohasta salina]|uniref:glutamyl-tRNA reductase n=1 Tax=Halohasta salina TaxID=2961621 RepID=UPI0020A3A1BA|nr:glutamyl-tRNA reductase [Halohasta salina]